jgi:hypothetical protein
VLSPNLSSLLLSVSSTDSTTFQYLALADDVISFVVFFAIIVPYEDEVLVGNAVTNLDNVEVETFVAVTLLSDEQLLKK